MTNKKLKKTTMFIFKRKPAFHLSKEEMQKIKGGGGNTSDDIPPSTLPGCVEDKPTLGTISL
ncbi:MULTISPECIES: hypothetical protein [Pedobacter]|uniref:hypothetical protein n=1 Tax=Pedobacter TaxID=84567 RepID=UPI00064966EE|nr:MULTISPECIES: hypothetical protein [Pedobacter]KLT64762.1 hypothetical protein AB669_13545 [Pedobacter sp. BMA]